jgi:hypothetical protein
MASNTSGQSGRRTSSSAPPQKNNTTPVKTRKEVIDKIASLEKEMARTQERMDNANNFVSRRVFESSYNRLMKSLDNAMDEYNNLPQEPRSQRVPPLKDSGQVRAAPRPVSATDAAQAVARDAKQLEGQAGEGRAGSGSSRPATVNTQSKKPLAKRIMEALGDNRPMAQATSDRKMTEEMEMEREMNVAGRKKGGMAKKKKAPVKKAYGGMVKKKHGGSANKVNMKAGFTRRGCSKG